MPEHDGLGAVGRVELLEQLAAAVYGIPWAAADEEQNLSPSCLCTEHSKPRVVDAAFMILG
jgi:hypothetical protein